MTPRQLAVKHNRSIDYFLTMRNRCKEKYTFITSFDKDMEKSIELYLEYMDKIKEKIIEECYRIGDDIFAEQLVKQKLFGKKESAMKNINYSLFASRTDNLNIRFTMVKKWIQIYNNINNGEIK